MDNKFVFAEITFTGEKAWGEVKEIIPTIGLGQIYSRAFFPFRWEGLRYQAYLYFSTIAMIKPKT